MWNAKEALFLSLSDCTTDVLGCIPANMILVDRPGSSSCHVLSSHEANARDKPRLPSEYYAAVEVAGLNRYSLIRSVQ